MTPDDYKKWPAGIDQRRVAGAERRAALCDAWAAMPATRAIRRHAGRTLTASTDPAIRMTDGSTMIANDAYLREKILNPSLHVPAGYVPIMPTYQGQISEEGLIDLVEYIKSLDSNYRLHQMMNKSELDSAQPAPIGRANQGAGAAPLQHVPESGVPKP